MASGPSMPSAVLEALDSVRQSSFFPLLFSAWFTERVYREEIDDYRDRLVVDKEEVKVVKAVRAAARRLKKAIGAAELKGKSPGAEKHGEGGVAFYVDLSTASTSSSNGSVPFGHYWFLVEGIGWGNKGVEWKARVVREVFQGDKSSTDKCPHCGKFPDIDASSATNSSSLNSTADDPLNFAEIAQSLHRTVRENVRPAEWLEEIRPYMTASNAVNAVKFVLVLAIAAVTGLARLLPGLLTLLNRTIHELAHLVRMSTPFLMACVEMVNKAVGGFYLLLAMMWRDFRRGPQQDSVGPAPPAPRYLQGPSEYPYTRRQYAQRPYMRNR